MSRRGTGEAGETRRIRPRDWIVVAVVALLALGLGGYLAFRPSGSGGDDAAPEHAVSANSVSDAVRPSGRAGTSSTATSPRPAARSSTAPTPSSAAATSAPDAQAAPSEPSAHPGPSGSASSAGDADASTGPSKAPPIGPLGDLSRRIEGDPLALGRVDAPVVMVSFEDLRCPFCALFSRTLEPKLVEKYVKSGILRIEWRDLPIFGPQSTQAAVAARAAAEQGMFWEFVRAIYADAPRDGHPDLPRATLIGYARQVGVPDVARFTAALDDPALAAAVDKDLQEGTALGVPSTPAFVINGYPIVGAQPLQQFTDLIDTVRTLR